MKQYKSEYKGTEMDASWGKANTAVQGVKVNGEELPKDAESKVEITLPETYTKEETDALLTNEAQAREGADNALSKQINLKQDKTDNSLTTSSKRVVGAINDHEKEIQTLKDEIGEVKVYGYFYKESSLGILLPPTNSMVNIVSLSAKGIGDKEVGYVLIDLFAIKIDGHKVGDGEYVRLWQTGLEQDFVEEKYFYDRLDFVNYTIERHCTIRGLGSFLEGVPTSSFTWSSNTGNGRLTVRIESLPAFGDYSKVGTHFRVVDSDGENVNNVTLRVGSNVNIFFENLLDVGVHNKSEAISFLLAQPWDVVIGLKTPETEDIGEYHLSFYTTSVRGSKTEEKYITGFDGCAQLSYGSLTELVYTKEQVDNKFATQYSVSLKQYIMDNSIAYPDEKTVVGAINKNKQRIDNLFAIGRYLAIWNAKTGLPTSNPSGTPYPYKAGDWFLVGIVADEGGTNYMPYGTEYTGEASTTPYTEDVPLKVGDRFFYDGTRWKPLVATYPEDNNVKYDEQTLTTAQQAQARNNINAQERVCDVSYAGATSGSNGKAFAVGINNSAARSGFVMGRDCSTQTENSMAGGVSSVASGSISVAIGNYVTASGRISTAIGGQTVSDGDTSYAQGHGSQAHGAYSHAQGDNTITNNKAEFAGGRFNMSHKASPNINKGNTSFSFGIGTSDTARKNAIEIMQQTGDIYIIGLGGYDGTNAGATGVLTLQQIINAITI